MNRILVIFALALFLSISIAAQDQPLRILEKPIPMLTDVQRKTNFCVQGTAALRVEFLASGEIGMITPVLSLPYGLTENVIDAAKKIRFEPETYNGQPKSRTKIVNYVFDIGWQKESTAKLVVQTDEKAEAILAKAVQNMGGDRYLKATSQFGRGRFSIIRDGGVASFQSFVDVIVYPDKERTEFKNAGVKTVQTNVGNTGWLLDGDKNLIKDQDEAQIKNFKQGIRTSLDNLLRGQWRKEATLTYAGKRPATLGKRNDILRLTYNDQGSVVEFEFSDDGFPAKAIYKRLGADNEEIKEEDRYAQFVDVSGIKAPFIIDRFSNGMQTSRINYESIEFNKSVPDLIFAKPSNTKELKKDLRL